VSKQNLEKAIAALEMEYEEMWAQTRGVRRSTVSADLAMLGARIDRYKTELEAGR
jgi:PPE-repeat protein